MVMKSDADSLPLDRLGELCEQKLRQSQVISKAGRSPFYRSKWEQAGLVQGGAASWEDLAGYPYTTGSELRKAQREYAFDDLLGGREARLWISTSGTTGAPKWIPLDDSSVLSQREKPLGLFASVPVGPEERSYLALIGPAPFISEPAVYNFLVSRLLVDKRVEITAAVLPESADALDFARRVGLNGLLAFPSLALVVAQGISIRAPEEALKRFRTRPGFVNGAAVLATRLFKLKARHIFRFKWGVFAGEPLEPYREAIRREYGMEPFAAYTMTEVAARIGLECQKHCGLHLDMDFGLAEIIPAEELEKEEADPAHIPRAIPIWRAKSGDLGELVLTTFSNPLPLIRYRTSDLIRIVGVTACACGRTSPRYRVLHRSDDLINLGLIRFSIYGIKEKMDRLEQSGQITGWQLRITRDHVKPKALILVAPGADSERSVLIKTVRDMFDDIEGVTEAAANGLIAVPEVRLVDRVEQERTASGKIRMAVYEEAYFHED